MIRAAERLFAEHGYRAVSMREVGAAAGQRNNSAAQYHFGSRRGLLEAILDYRMTPINERRLELLAEMAAEGRSNDLRSKVEALIVPSIEEVVNRGRNSYYARFLLQVAFLPGVDLLSNFSRPYTAGVRIVEEGILHAMDHLPRVVAMQRLALVNRLMLSAMADQERLAASSAPDQPWSTLVTSDLIDISVAMVTAPVSDDTRRGVADLAAGAGKGATGPAPSSPSAARRRSGTPVTSRPAPRAAAQQRGDSVTRKVVR